LAVLLGWHVWKLPAVALAAALLLAGCGATGEQFKVGAIKPPSGRALLYVYRPSTVVGIGNPDVAFLHLDGRPLTRIRIGGYLAVPISPGQHKATTTQSMAGSDTGKVLSARSFSAHAGSTVYLRYTEGFSSFVPIVLPNTAVILSSTYHRFDAVPEREALAELAETQVIQRE
jgi:hypothetical protein